MGAVRRGGCSAARRTRASTGRVRRRGRVDAPRGGGPVVVGLAPRRAGDGLLRRRSLPARRPRARMTGPGGRAPRRGRPVRVDGPRRHPLESPRLRVLSRLRHRRAPAGAPTA